MNDRKAVISRLEEIAKQPTEDGIVDGICQQTIKDAIKLLNACCGNCHWYHDEHCTNAESWYCTDTRLGRQLCESWESRT